jgi:hypothetical protein
MANDNEREARVARSLKRLDHRLVKRPSGGFAIADLTGKIIQDEAVFAKRLSLDDVEAWIKEYIRPKPKRKA